MLSLLPRNLELLTHQDNVKVYLRGLVCAQSFETVFGFCVLKAVLLRERYKEL